MLQHLSKYFIVLFIFISQLNAQTKKSLSSLDNQLVTTAENMISSQFEKGKFSGTILIAHKDSILFEKAYGEASKSYHVLNNMDTKFNIGSNNKMFTATAIMQLYKKQLLKLDTPISQYIDTTWLPEKITDKITIDHLLTHTSGLGDFFNERFEKSSKALFREIKDFKPLVKSSTLAFEPGTNTQYSNTGMLLLGVIIENITGQTYFEYVNKFIYKPIGMEDTGCFEMDMPVENLATGYSFVDGLWENNLFKHVIKGGPSGGGFSTARDLYKFGQSLLNKKLLPQPLLDKQLKIHQKLHGPTYKNYGYGYGFVVIEGKNTKVVGHLGGFYGISSGFFVSLDTGHIISVLSNYDAVGTQVAVELSKILVEN